MKRSSSTRASALSLAARLDSLEADNADDETIVTERHTRRQSRTKAVLLYAEEIDCETVTEKRGAG